MESTALRSRIDKLNPVDEIQQKAKDTAADIAAEAGQYFMNSGYGMDYEFTDEKQARRFIAEFSKKAENLVYPMGTDLTALIDSEIQQKGYELLEEYKKYLNRVDENAGSNELSFKTSELIGDQLQAMQEIMADLSDTGYAVNKVDEVGEG